MASDSITDDEQSVLNNERSTSKTRTRTNIKRLLKLAVKSTPWTYCILWKLSRTRGRLLWGDGFYNGDMKITKTAKSASQSGVSICDEVRAERCVQLRHLFLSLQNHGDLQHPECTVEEAALSLEDLTDAEWFYLVSMTFDFDPSHSLPGIAMEQGKAVWLCRASEVESRIFSRALLAKSAGIQTMLWIPLDNGVLELGNTHLLAEDAAVVAGIRDVLRKKGVEETSSGESFASEISMLMADNKEGSVSTDLCEKGKSSFTKRACKVNGHVKSVRDSSQNLQTAKTDGDAIEQGRREGGLKHVLAERKRRTKINEKIMALHSIVHVASNPKMDKASVLDNTISFVKSLQHKVQELETQIKETEEVMKRTNCSSKRKLNIIDEACAANYHDNDDGHDINNYEENIQVSIIEDDAWIKMSCGWKEGLPLQIMEVLGNLEIHAYNVLCRKMSHNWFVATIKAKMRKQMNGQRLKTDKVKDAIEEIIRAPHHHD